MANWFENLTKTLADEKLSRRQAMKKAAGITATVALASLIPAGKTFAASPDRHACKNPGTCSGAPFNNCGDNSNCYCFQKIGSTTGVCGCNSFCSSLAPCTSQSQCAKGSTCITNNGCGCTSGVCIPNCGEYCFFPVHAGRTAA